jgi:CubicO group peptidase (beta-lactamase class C family)
MRIKPALIAVAVGIMLAGVGSAGMTATAESSAGDNSGRFDRPHNGFAPASTVLSDAAPEAVGLDPAPIRRAEQRLDEWTRSADGHPLFSGAVGLLAHGGAVVDVHSTGAALRYADGKGTELPPEQQVPMRPDTIFDLASISKLFTSIAVMQLVERGEVDINAPVSRYLPEFGVNGKEDITVRQLLTHTSGLEPFLPLWRDWPDEASRIKAVMDVTPVTEPGSAYEYSDLNLITLGVLVERITGSGLDTVVEHRIAGPLGMSDTGYNPPPSKLDRIAATEFQTVPDRGMVRGRVHDENAWSLGGVAGHAGVFSTARDLAVLGQAILNGGTYDGARILRPDTVRAMLTDYNERFPGDAHGLGFELDQIWYMGGLTGPATAGHTGFTGTSLVIDPASRSIAILLTNRVHPSRSWGSINPARRAWATGLAQAMAVTPVRGTSAWFAAPGDDAAATLTTPALTRGDGRARLRFAAFVHSEASDHLTVQASSDGKSWTTVPMTVAGRAAPADSVEFLSGTGHRTWWQVTATLPEDTVSVRWQFTTDSSYTARGVHVDGLLITDSTGVVFDGERDEKSLVTAGWQSRTR